VWDAVKPYILHSLSNPNLEGRLARYFAALNEINNSMRLHRDRALTEVGGVVAVGKAHAIIRTLILSLWD
jgi:hypothetical protein